MTTYGTIGLELKVRCNVPSDDSSEDDALTVALEQADGWLEEGLRPYIDVDADASTFPTYVFNTFPLEDIPKLAMDAYYDYAAGCYKQAKMPLDIDPTWFTKADTKFKIFKEMNWGQIYFEVTDLAEDEY